jgi:uncharacterized membrane protein
VLELTEVVALVFALGADASSIRSGAEGAVAGTAVVSALALGFGAAIITLPESYLRWAAALTLAAFGVFLFRSTLKSYRRSHAGPAASPVHRTLQFAGGFSVGAVETTEAVIVLIALAAAGYGVSAIIGAVVGGVLLLALAAILHDRIRRIKVPPLKLVGTSLLFTFAVFWAGEGLGYSWPYDDLALVPLFVLALAMVRAGVAVAEGRRPTMPVGAKG